MKEMIQYLVKSSGLDQKTLIILGVPLGIFLEFIQKQAESVNMSLTLIIVLGCLFVADMFFGVLGALSTKGNGVMGTEFLWTKFLTIFSKSFLFCFVVALAYLCNLATKAGYDFFLIDIGDDTILTIASLQHLKSALENTRKIGQSDVVDALLLILNKFDGVVNFKKSKKNGVPEKI